jgi:hypothetical protein
VFKPNLDTNEEFIMSSTTLDIVHLASPGELRVYDPQNKITGMINGEIKEDIPLSFYDGDKTIVIMNPSGDYKYEVKGTDTGSYGLYVAHIESTDPYALKDIYALNIPTTSGQNHQYTINWEALSNGEKGVTLQIDYEGDGIFERTINAGPTLADIIPPTTTNTIFGTFGNNNWYRSNVQINLTATDNEGGSGVNKTEYSFDNATWIEYNAEFPVTTEGTTTLYYRSTDNAGNIESTKNITISIDKTSPSITGAATTAPNVNGWYNTSVLVHFTASDEASGIDPIKRRCFAISNRNCY